MLNNGSNLQSNTCSLNDHIPFLNCPTYMTRADEVTYYKLNSTQKEDYLIKKYFTLSHLPNLYLNYFPNVKEFFNNAAWRIAIDTAIETFIPGLDSDPFHKEVAYNVAGIPSALTSAYWKLNIGSSNNTYTWTHALYALERGALKTVIVGAVAYHNPSKLKTKGGLEGASTAANYIADAGTRHIPFSTERLQADPDADVSSYRFHAQAIISAITRTVGSQTGSYIFTLKLKPLVNLIFSREALGLTSSIKSVAVSKDNPINVVQSSKTTIERVSEDCKKGAFTCIESLAFELISKIAFNFIGAIIQQPSSRISGIFGEEVFEYYFPTQTKDDTMPGTVASSHTEEL